MLEEVALAPRVVNDLPVALYAKYAFASIPDSLTVPNRVGDCPSKDAKASLLEYNECYYRC